MDSATPPHIFADYQRAFLSLAGGLNIVLNSEGYILYASEETCNLLGYPPAALKGAAFSSFADAQYRSLLVAAIATPSKNPVCLKLMSGMTEERWFDVTVRRITIKVGEHAFLVYGHDVTKWKQESQALESKYLRDPLTGTGNRIVMKAVIEKGILSAKETGKSFAIALLDLDGFKKVNDTFGHDVGDSLLQEAAKRLTRNIRSSDAVVRMGGDEFVILFTDVSDKPAGVQMAERVVKAFQQPFYIGNLQLRVTTSLGLAFADFPNASETDLLKRADLAMYEAKEKGKNQFALYTEELQQSLQSHMDVEQSMYAAIQSGEFHLEYQPIFDPKTLQVHSLETLMRWDKATGRISPEVFIPLAEQNGLIHILGQWALRNACAQLVKWEKEGIFIRSIAVNISPVQLAHPRFAESVKSAVYASGVNPSRLTLEITEGTLMDDPDYSTRVLSELREFGVGFSVDDFGTGYSSLAYLKRFPLQALKIDRSFITDMLICPQSKTIVDAVLSLAKALGLRVVAEGVETVAQCAALAEQECEFAQGWLVSKALKPEDLVAQLKLGKLVLAPH